MKLKSIIGLLFLPALVFTVQAAEFPLCLNGDGCGFLNADGTWRKTTAFDEVGEFSSDGLAPVRQGNKWGFINLQGQIIHKTMERQNIDNLVSINVSSLVKGLYLLQISSNDKITTQEIVIN